LALYCHYAVHYEGFAGVQDEVEWEPSLIAMRRKLEDRFLSELRSRNDGPTVVFGNNVEAILRELIAGPSSSRYASQFGSLSQFVECHADTAQFREYLVHRSIYQLKEADAHTWGIPRFRGTAKSALVAIQMDEYGQGTVGATHAERFANTMESFELVPSMGWYIDAVPAITLAADNLASLFGLHRSLRGALIGHLALFEMTSVAGMRRYGHGVRRLGGDDLAAGFFDEHVHADSIHDQLAGQQMVGGALKADPSLADDVVFGVRSAMDVGTQLADHLLSSWLDGRSSLLPS
jgi:hypothetical protein